MKETFSTKLDEAKDRAIKMSAEQLQKMLETENDLVNSPKHYTQGRFETIDIILDTVQHLPGREGYLVGNIIKYLSRFHFKNGQQDLEKARWYLNKLLEILQEEKTND